LDGIRRACDFFGGVPKEILFDNAKSIILERDAYGEGNHRWHPKLLDLSKEYGFVPKVCRPYRPRTKGKVERFNRYLKENFVTPLAATFRAQSLQLNIASANGAIGAWLNNVANERIHATTLVKPNVRLAEEKQHLLPLPISNHVAEAVLPADNNRPIPVESIQHPLNIYDQFMAGSFV
jgi:transposase